MGFQAVGKRVTGASHRKAGIPCQDALLYREYRGSLIMSVADGHGSPACKYSSVGSDKAVDAFYEVMCELIDNPQGFHAFVSRHRDDLVPRKIHSRWMGKIETFHRRTRKAEEFSPLYYGTTLLGLVVSPDSYFAFQIGDGDILGVSLQGKTMHILEGHKILGMETESLSSEFAWLDAVTTVKHVATPAEYPAVFMLATDGIRNSYLSEEGFLACGRDYLDLIREHGLGVIDRHLRGWLREISEGGSGDDVTLLLAANDQVLTAPGNMC